MVTSMPLLVSLNWIPTLSVSIVGSLHLELILRPRSGTEPGLIWPAAAALRVFQCNSCHIIGRRGLRIHLRLLALAPLGNVRWGQRGNMLLKSGKTIAAVNLIFNTRQLIFSN